MMHHQLLSSLIATIHDRMDPMQAYRQLLAWRGRAHLTMGSCEIFALLCCRTGPVQFNLALGIIKLLFITKL